jgi:cell division protein FtsQ
VLWILPLALLGGLGGGAVLSGWSPGSPTPLGLSAALGLVVNNIDVEGRETTDRDTIMKALGAHAGMPILAVNPTHAKDQLESLPWVRSAVIERRLPDTIFVRLVERQPLAVWQHEGKQELIDRDGTVIPVTDLTRFARLPTVVGGDAARQGAAVLLDLLAKEPAIASRVTAAVLVGERRWNVRIDNAIDVLLPETDMAGAWAKLAQLERTTQLLQRDVETVDLRLPDRLVMKINDPAPPKDTAPAKKPHPAGKST